MTRWRQSNAHVLASRYTIRCARLVRKEVNPIAEEVAVATATHTAENHREDDDHTAGMIPMAVETVLARYREQISTGLHSALTRLGSPTDLDETTRSLLRTFYGQMEYHFGWRDADLSASDANPGKLLRPTLVLLGCELAAGRAGQTSRQRRATASRAIPAALAIEMVHNFSLIHDDIEDSDEERRHRPTLWRVWGQPQAINTGDGMFALARLTLFDLVESGVPPALVCRLAVLLDRTCLELCEGQHLDMSFEGRHDVTAPMYMAMIERKTAALMDCALQLGARVGGAGDELSAELGAFGRALGLGFQLRDDLLGIWAHRDVLGKTAAGDLRRKKMSLPVIHALQHATTDDREALLAIYAAAGPADDRQVALALAVLERTGARDRVRQELATQSERAQAALDTAAGRAPTAREPYGLLATLLRLVSAESDS